MAKKEPFVGLPARGRVSANALDHLAREATGSNWVKPEALVQPPPDHSASAQGPISADHKRTPDSKYSRRLLQQKQAPVAGQAPSGVGRQRLATTGGAMS